MASEFSKWWKKTTGMPEVNLLKKAQDLGIDVPALLKGKSQEEIQKVVDELPQEIFDALRPAVMDRYWRESMPEG